MQAILALEDGRVFRGKGYGAKGECYGEVVFNTSITGYQEIFTDPSYAGQIVVLTNPQIGNYGANAEDNEATRPYIEGLIVREFSKVSSNWRSQQVAEEYLEQFKIPVLADIDTRALVRHLRDKGVMRGVISTMETDIDKLVAKARSIPKMDGTDLAKVVTTNRPYVWEVGERSHASYAARDARSPWSRRRPPQKTFSRSNRAGCSSRTAPAIPSLAPTQSTTSAALWDASRSSASVLATSLRESRSAARPSS